jgi:toxin-antitoxin system PIN domain toxin
MIAVDTNILVYAHREESSQHETAQQVVQDLGLGNQRWAIPWPCLLEFFNVVTRTGLWPTPTPPQTALAVIDLWLTSPSLTLLHEDVGYWPILKELAQSGRIAGPRIHDARIAALCLHHGVRELWTADRDFSRFPLLKTRNPLVRK